MTDSSELLPNNVAVISDCLFNLKPSAVRSRSYRASIYPTNKSTFSPSDVAILYVPGGRRSTYLDPQQTYLRMTVKNMDGTNPMTVDNNGSSFINRADLFHGGSLLESIQAYNVLYAYIMDIQANSSQRAGLSTMYGFGADGGREGIALASATPSVTFCMPLLGVLGLGSDKMIPIGALKDDLRLELTFENLISSVVYPTGATNWQITDLELELQIIEMSDEGESLIREATPYDRPVFLHTNSWRHYVSSYTPAIGNFVTLVPARFASLKTIVLLPRRNIDAVAAGFTISARVNPNFATVNYRIGSSIVPNKFIVLENSNTTAGFAEGFAETMKSWHALNTSIFAGVLTSTVYNARDTALAGTVIGAATGTEANTYNLGFCLAIELESFAQRSDILLSGVNTLSSQVFFEANVITAATSGAYTLDFFANFDQILVLENGMLSVRF